MVVRLITFASCQPYIIYPVTLFPDGNIPMKPAEFISENKEGMIKDLETLVNFETPSTDKDLLDRAADYLLKYVEKNLSCEAELIENATAGNNVSARIGRGAVKKPLLILAHYDTVWSKGTLSRIPFSISNGIARGPGIFDMKGGLVQGLWALRSLEEYGRPNRPIEMLITSDEETGSNSSRELIETKARASEAALVLEPPQDGKVKTARKGIGEFSINVLGKAAHAGLEPWKGVNAIEEAARVILFLQSLNRIEKGTTINVCTVNGGTRTNVIADHTSLGVDFRVASEAEAKNVVKSVMSIKPNNPSIKLEISGGLNRPPMQKTYETARLLEVAKTIGAEFGTSIEDCTVGGGSDGNFCAAVGIPVLDGLGAVGNGAHAETEFVDLNQMPLRAAIFERLLEEL